MADEQRSPGVWLATCGAVGYFPVAPGTAGSLVGVAIAAGLANLFRNGPWTVVALVLVAAILFALGTWSAGRAEEQFGRVDPGPVVIDEVVGQIVTLLARPHANWKWLVGGFVAFRIFDIIKPFPAGRAERLPDGLGIMADDVVAGLYGFLTLACLGFFLP
ncbi:MAG TPA: phosphatidylglycerophosphatase A [Terriglobia bacterium]|nr:phosphatidylglycerophosphatase A [Terriglobia bacterium]